MSIPLDRLYNFLYDIINRDNIIIYRFYPHGSKDISNLTAVDFKPGWKESMTNIALICNDQEPLNFEMYKNVVPKIPKLPEHCTELIDYRNFHGRGLKSVLFSCNLNDHCLLLHSEKNSRNLQMYIDDDYIGVYYWSHGIIARDWFRYANIDPVLKQKQTNPEKDFLIYNRAWSGTREYRLKFTELLLKNDLVAKSNVKFNPVDSGVHYTNHFFNNVKFKPDITNLEDFFVLNTTTSCFSADYDNNDYATSGIEIVLETLFDDERQHLTEKILRPIACGLPWILAGTPGSLQYLRDYGFKTFDPLINESYDLIKDPVQRLHAIVNEMKRISQLSSTQKQQLFGQLKEIAEFNQTRFFSDEFFKSLLDEFNQNFKTALDTLSPLRKGKKWVDYIKLMYHKYPDFYQERAIENKVSRQDTIKFHQWRKNPPQL